MEKIKIDSGTHKKTTSKHYVAIVPACRYVCHKSLLRWGVLLLMQGVTLCLLFRLSFPNVIAVAPHVVALGTDFDVRVVAVDDGLLLPVGSAVACVVDAHGLHDIFAHELDSLNFGTYVPLLIVLNSKVILRREISGCK